ncbi:hypothetical protein BCR42DRAFT_447920 [Absidia repens]|uniref:DH domain-containing protein n=1 Tax=Absidia repens TaxID=90262 RepID=A0A1X2IV13_9FUNG|nr:hypothetical protein BCR42DRAFT_447920 [Absidia repens]
MPAFTNFTFFTLAGDKERQQQSKQQFLSTENQYMKLLKLLDTELGTKNETAFRDWLSAIKELEQIHSAFYKKLDAASQDNGVVDAMIYWGNTLEKPYLDYIESYGQVQSQHQALLCASIRSIIKNMSPTLPYDSIEDLLAAPLDQLELYKSIYLALLDTSDSSKQLPLSNITQNIDTLLTQFPPPMIDSTSALDLPAFQKFVDCENVIDLFTGASLDYQLRSTPGKIILQDDFLLLADCNDQPPLPVHMVLTSDILMICKQMAESTGCYDLLYPPLAVNDILVKSSMMDRELIGEYTLELTVLSKILVLRAESREVRNVWTGIPSTTTPNDMNSTNIPLTKVVCSAENSKTRLNGNEMNTNSTKSLNLTRNGKSELDSFYGNHDISPVESSEDDVDDTDDDNDSNATTASYHQQYLVDKKSLPSLPTKSEPQPPKKDSVIPPPKDITTPMINISLHDDKNNADQSSCNRPITPRGSSIRAPLPNPALRPNLSSTFAPEMKPLPRTSSIRNRQQDGPRPENDHLQSSKTVTQQPHQQETATRQIHHSHQHQHQQQIIAQNMTDMRPQLGQQQKVNYGQTMMTQPQSAAILPNTLHQQIQHHSPPPPPHHHHYHQDPATSAQRSIPSTPPPQQSQFTTSSSSSSEGSSSQSHLPLTPGSCDSFGSSLRMSPEDLVTPPRSPNPYSTQQNGQNGIRQVLFRSQQCEVFRWNDESWYAVEGQCLLEVRQTFTNRSCIAIRVQTTDELYLNVWVLPQTQIRLASPTDISLGVIMGSQAETYLVHFGEPSEANELNQVLQKMHYAAVLAARQPNDGMRTLRGEPPTEMMTAAMHFDDDDDLEIEANGTMDTAANDQIMTRNSSLMQSGNEPTLIPQTLEPAMQCKCKLFVQNEHSNWSSFGSVQLLVSLQVPSQRIHIQIDHEKKRGLSKIIPTVNSSSNNNNNNSPTSPSPSSSPSSVHGIDNGNTSTTANTLVINERERTSSMVYMVQLRDEESGNALYDYLKVKNAQHGW